MIDLEKLRQSARIIQDERGELVAQIPLNVWEAWLMQQSHASDALSPKNQSALALLDAWDADSDQPSEAWWDEFEAFIKANRLSLS